MAPYGDTPVKTKLKCTCDEYLISLQTEMRVSHGVWCGHGGILSTILSTRGTNQHFELRADKFFFESNSDRDREVLKNKI